jgi:hypothetical protein
LRYHNILASKKTRETGNSRKKIASSRKTIAPPLQRRE